MSREIRIEYPDGTVVKEFTDKTDEQLAKEAYDAFYGHLRPHPVNPLLDECPDCKECF